MPDIRIDNVSFAYSGSANLVLHSINLTLSQGEFVLLAGPSGCGKSTLALAVAGLVPVRIAGRLRGSIFLGEKNVRKMDIHEISQEIGIVFQNPEEQLIHLDVESEVAFGMKHGPRHLKDLPISLDELLRVVDLTSYRQTNPFHLSFGQRKRLAIGALLICKPALLILDEPTTGQDEDHAVAFLQFLEQLRKREQLTYIMITHDMRAVARYASRVIVLSEGRVLMDDTPERIFAQGDELERCGIFPPTLARLHTRLCDGQASRVALSLAAFLQLMQPLEVPL